MLSKPLRINEISLIEYPGASDFTTVKAATGQQDFSHNPEHYVSDAILLLTNQQNILRKSS